MSRPPETAASTRSCSRSSTPTERLTSLVRAHIRHLRRRRVEHLVGLHERTALTPKHLAEVDGYRQYYNRRVRDLLVAGMRSGEFRPLNPELAALGLLDMLNGVSGWIRGTSDDDVEQVVETYLHLLFDGLSADAAGESQPDLVPPVEITRPRPPLP